MPHDPSISRHDAAAQAAAEQPPRIDEPATVRSYRRMFAALRELPIGEPPSDFGMRMEGLVRDAGEQAVLEVWLVRCCALIAVVAGAVFAAPILLGSLVDLGAQFGEHGAWWLPAMIVLGAVWLGDHWLARRS